jgi:hypothetical protein
MKDLIYFLKRNTLAAVGAGILAVLLVAVIVGPFLVQSPIAIDMGAKLQAPGIGSVPTTLGATCFRALSAAGATRWPSVSSSSASPL